MGVLFSDTALTGENGYGYYDDSDPAWFEWRGTWSCTAESWLHRGLLSPLITIWHVVAQNKPTGKWRYRGAFTRHTVFTPDSNTTGLVLRRTPAHDIMEPHTSLQEPLAHHLQFRVPIPFTPLGRAKFAMAEALSLRFSGLLPVTWQLAYPEPVNIWIFNTLTAELEMPTFFLNLINDQVPVTCMFLPQKIPVGTLMKQPLPIQQLNERVAFVYKAGGLDRHTHTLDCTKPKAHVLQVYQDIPETLRRPELVRPSVDTHSKEAVRYIWEALHHAPDAELACYSDSEED